MKTALQEAPDPQTAVRGRIQVTCPFYPRTGAFFCTRRGRSVCLSPRGAAALTGPAVMAAAEAAAGRGPIIDRL